MRPTLGELRSIVARTPTPVDADGIPARAYCIGLPDGRYGVVYGRDGGRLLERVGPPFDRGRDALTLVELLNGAAGLGR